MKPRKHIALAILSATSALPAQPCGWTPLGDGIDGSPAKMTSFDDGSGPALYLTGFLISARGQPATDILRWDGEDWTDIGGIGGSGADFAVFDDGAGEAIYVALPRYLKFGVEPLVQRWDGQSWSGFGGGIQASHLTFDGVFDLQVYDDGSGPALFAGGRFTGANGNNMSQWRGGIWQPVGDSPTAPIQRKTVFDGGSGAMLYAVTRVPAGSPAVFWRWDGSAWERLPFTSDGPVFDLEVFDDGTGPALYAAGDFASIDGVNAGGLAKWDGAAWSAVGSGVSGIAWSLGVVNDGRGPALFVGGEFTSIGGVEARNIARITATGFEPLGAGAEGPTVDLCEFDDGSGPGLYATGAVFAGPAHIARWSCQTCYPDCDPSTGQGVLDIFDFLCFQDAFVKADPYACDCDTTGGSGVCDILDFLCFQDAFVAGCP